MTTLYSWAVYFESWEPNNNKNFWWSLSFAWIKLMSRSSCRQTTLGPSPAYSTSLWTLLGNICWDVRCFVLKPSVHLRIYWGFAGCPPNYAFTSGVSKLGRGVVGDQPPCWYQHCQPVCGSAHTYAVVHGLASRWHEPLPTHCWEQLHLCWHHLCATQCRSLFPALGGHLLATASNLWWPSGPALRGRQTTAR